MPDTKFIVGIGSSAGGLEALRSLFSAVKEEAAVAFVVVQHLAPAHKSRLVEILAQSTKLKVKEAQDGVNPEPNTIYVTPPNSDIRYEKGALRLMEPHVKVGPKPSVDVFLRSLAENAGASAIGIILSGTGSDGAQGVRAIKAAGGFTIAQTAKTAKYDGMPLAAKYTGAVDLELSPEEIAYEILHYSKSAIHPAARHYGPAEEDHFQTIFHILEREKGTCFKNYKPSTLKRRVERRMVATRCNTLEKYANYLQSHPGESGSLFQDILISVTSFFRDGEAFKSLEAHIERRMQSKELGDNFRCWVIGCATGEEAYSVAMVLCETMERLNKSLTLQIFATDLDETALSIARRGCYSRGSFEQLPKRLQDKYFIPADGQLQIRPSLRDLIVFARHNVANDPPFLSTDLVSCRNVLIYFNPSLQEAVFKSVAYSLRQGGILFLGRSETISPSVSQVFEIKDKESKIYHASGKNDEILIPSAKAASFENAPRETELPAAISETIGMDLFHSMVVGFAPNSIVIDKEHRVQHVYGKANEVLRFPSGATTYDISKLLAPEMSLELSSLLFRADKTNTAARGREHEWYRDGERTLLQMVVAPLQSSAEPRQYLISFEMTPVQARDNDKAENDPSEGPTEQHVAELEKELRSTKEMLQSVMEEYETGNEELQSLNEELQSANEELQSSNEELETTNEELQSTNEELTTLNQELNVKSSELQMLYNRHQAIQNAIAYPLLIIDKRMNILDFNPSARHLLRVQKSDIGLQLRSVPTRMDLSEVTAAVADAMKGQRDKRFQFKTKDRSFEVQIQLFHGDSEEVEGAVVSFVDNTEITVALDETKVIKSRLASIIDNTPAMITMKDLSGVYVFANNRFCRVTNKKEQDIIGCDDEELFGADTAKTIREKDFEVLKQEEPLEFEEHYVIDGKTRFWTSSKFTLFDPKHRPYSVCTISLDITDRVLRQHQLELFRRAVTFANSGTVILEDYGDGLVTSFCSEQIGTLLGVPSETLIGAPLHAFFKKINFQGKAHQLKKLISALESGQGNVFTFVAAGADERHVTFEMRSARIHTDDDRRGHLILSIFDISARLKDQQTILSQQEELSRYGRYSALGEIAAGISHEINTPLNVITANTDILKTAVRFEKLTNDMVIKSSNDIEKMAKGISSIVLGLKSVAGIDPENFELATMQKVIEDAIKICEFRLQRSDIELDVDMPDADIEVCCYPIQVMQVIINLVNNALEATAGRKDPWIRIVLSEIGNDRVRVLVEDSGMGIDPAIAEKIMTPFFSTKKKGEGTGIGLSLSRSIARRHNGDLYVDHNAPNTAFCLEIAKHQLSE